MKKVCYFGIYDPKHWRTRVITRGLGRMGYEVVECRVDPRQVKGIRKYVELYSKFKSLRTEFDFVVVGFPGYLAAAVASFMTSSPIIFDAYISYFDSIRDRKNYPLIHPMMWLAWVVDFVSCNLSDVVLTINFAYRDFFVDKLRVPSRKVEVLHKGADDEIFYPREKKDHQRIRVGWWGSFIPLHGLPVILNAANLLRDESIDFVIIGSGQLSLKIRSLAEELGLTNINFLPHIPQSELVGEIVNFDIVLGIFSPEPKALRCVTNKVYEAMSMSKAIITEESPANKEIFTHKKNVYMVEPGNPRALAASVLELSRDTKLRESLGQNARALFNKRFTTEKIEEEFVGIINRHINV